MSETPNSPEALNRRTRLTFAVLTAGTPALAEAGFRDLGSALAAVFSIAPSCPPRPEGLEETEAHPWAIAQSIGLAHEAAAAVSAETMPVHRRDQLVFAASFAEGQAVEAKTRGAAPEVVAALTSLSDALRAFAGGVQRERVPEADLLDRQREAEAIFAGSARHVDGAVYRVEGAGFWEEDMTPVVVYTSPAGVRFVRRQARFAERFQRASPALASEDMIE